MYGQPFNLMLELVIICPTQALLPSNSWIKSFNHALTLSQIKLIQRRQLIYSLHYNISSPFQIYFFIIGRERVVRKASQPVKRAINLQSCVFYSAISDEKMLCILSRLLSQPSSWKRSHVPYRFLKGDPFIVNLLSTHRNWLTALQGSLQRLSFKLRWRRGTLFCLIIHNCLKSINFIWNNQE